MPESPSAELELTWQRLAIDPSALTVHEDGTLASAHPEVAAREVPLPRLRGPDSTDEIDVEGLLGEGGIGMVFLGAQRSLLREVAVKVARPKAGAATEAALLREARVTGALQHPGVVPVHMVGVDEWGHAMVIMKRLPSRTWTTRLGGKPQRGADLDRELASPNRYYICKLFVHQIFCFRAGYEPGRHREAALVPMAVVALIWAGLTWTFRNGGKRLLQLVEDECAATLLPRPRAPRTF